MLSRINLQKIFACVDGSMQLLPFHTANLSVKAKKGTSEEKLFRLKGTIEANDVKYRAERIVHYVNTGKNVRIQLLKGRNLSEDDLKEKLILVRKVVSEAAEEAEVPIKMSSSGGHLKISADLDKTAAGVNDDINSKTVEEEKTNL